MQIVLTVLAAYCLGSVSFAIVVSRALRLPDPRTYGSKNPGATNVLRTGRRAAAVLTLAGDGGKGWLAVWLAELISPGSAALAGLAAFIGHLFPVFHRFQGGKGVATAAGVLFGIDWRIGLGTLATWIIIALFLRYSSLAALVAAAFAPPPPATTNRVSPSASKARTHVASSTSTTASTKARAMSAEFPCCLTSISAAVFSPEKLKSRSPLPSIGRGNW